jgi:hypothetical protein|tara:strand:- start:167 stop:307 length:141 start_codon:yes stop_codon:yes gene_type:complete
LIQLDDSEVPNEVKDVPLEPVYKKDAMTAKEYLEKRKRNKIKAMSE